MDFIEAIQDFRVIGDPSVQTKGWFSFRGSHLIYCDTSDSHNYI